MQPVALRKWILMLALVSLSILALTAASLPSAPARDSRVTLPGHQPRGLSHAQALGATSSTQQLQLSIGLPLRNEGLLNLMLRDMYNPNSPHYHQFLTPDIFNQWFAPTQASVNRATTWLQQQGLHVTSVAPNHLLINASGSVAQVERAFQVQIRNYRQGGRTFYAPANNPSLPLEISDVIQSVNGLDNMGTWHPELAPRIPHTGPGGGYTPSELRTAYNFSGIISNGDQGDGQTVAIFELDGYKSSDITAYLNNYGLSGGSYSNVYVDGFNGSAGSGAIEVELDMEVVFAVAPHVTELIYEGPNTTQGVNDTYNKIVTDNRAQVVSISWGLCEADSGTAELQTLDNIFRQGASQGISFFAASGDSGAYDCNTTSLAVDSPADDPYVTGVGGTFLSTGSGGTYSSESAWSCSSCSGRGPKGTGGGGGLSTYFSQPSWQQGPGVQNSYSNGMREVPDVSADADPNSGYSVYCTVSASGCPSSGWISVGGTSAAAPLWAGAAADINQYLTGLGKSRLGFANPTWYLLACNTQTYAPFHDVTSGNNLYYPATSGYDLATGIGTPNVWNMARDLGAGISTTCSGGGGGGGGGQLIVNGGFENGQSPWQESSSGGYQLIDPTLPHTGSYSAYLCGYNYCIDQIWQAVALPSSFTRVTLTFWWYMNTQESGSTCYDYFYVRLRTSGGSTIQTVFQKCNANANNAWQQVNLDVTTTLSSYKGQTIQVYFRGTTDSSLITNVFVDDVALTVS